MVFLAIREKDMLKKPPLQRLIYPIQQIILLAGCSTAEPDSSFDLQMKGK